MEWRTVSEHWLQTGKPQEQHCSTRLISCWSFTHLFEKNTSGVLPTKDTYMSHSQSLFRNWVKENSIKTVKYPKKHKGQYIHGIHLRKVPKQVASWWFSHPKSRGFKETKLLSSQRLSRNFYLNLSSQVYLSKLTVSVPCLTTELY